MPTAEVEVRALLSTSGILFGHLDIFHHDIVFGCKRLKLWLNVLDDGAVVNIDFATINVVEIALDLCNQQIDVGVIELLVTLLERA